MKVWTYGCSFTAGYKELMYSDYLWDRLLSFNREYIAINRGHGGGGFHNVRENILQDIGKISKDDLIILQLPTSNRVVIPYFKKEWDSFMRIRYEQPEGTIGWLSYLKDFDERIQAYAREVSLIFDLLKRLHLKWVWWPVEDTSEILDKYSNNRLEIVGHSTFEKWIWSSKEYWYAENDWHQSILGHKTMADSFSKQIIQFYDRLGKETKNGNHFI